MLDKMNFALYKVMKFEMEERMRGDWGGHESGGLFGDWGKGGTSSKETKDTLTVERLLKLKQELNQMYPSYMPVQQWCGMPVFESKYMPTEYEEYEEEVPRTWRERLWEPLKHGATLPFEPWVKTKWVTKRREVSGKAMMFNGVLFCSPVVRSKLFGDLTV